MGKVIFLRFLSTLGTLVQGYRRFKGRLFGYKLGKNVILESKLNLDRVYPELITIGDDTLVGSRVTILSHEHIFREEGAPLFPKRLPVKIGKRCFIGVGAVILPGVTIGDECVVGASTVVTKDVPDNSMVVGVPGKVIKKVSLDKNTHVKEIW